MFALQTPPPSLGPLLVAFVGLALAGGIVGALGTVVVRRLSNPVGKYRLLYAAVLFPFALLSYALLALLGFGPAVVAALPALPDLPGAVLANLVDFLAAGAVWLIAYAPTVRGVRAARDIDLSTGTALAKMIRYVLGVSVVLAVAIAPLRTVPSDASPLYFAAALAVIGVGFQYASPWLVPLLRSTRAPSGEHADRIETLCSRAGLDVRDVHVVDSDEEETANAFVRGPPGYRRLFVTSTFLDAFADEHAAALLAIETGRIRHRLLEIRLFTVVVGGLALIASVTGAGPRWPLLGLALGAVVLGFWLSRRRVLAADAFAADRVGAAVLADALDRYAAVHSLDPSRRRFPNPLSVNVALGDRIDRVRDRERP